MALLKINYTKKLLASITWFSLGIFYYKNRDWEKSLKYFEKSIVHNELHALSHFKIGMCFYKQKKWDRAARNIETAIKLNKYNKEWQWQYFDALSKIEIKAERWSSAEEALTNKLTIRQDAETFQSLANVQRNQAKWQAEIKALQDAISLDDKQPSWFYRLGEAQEALECYSEAVIAYSKAIECLHKKTPPQWHYVVGYCLERLADQSSSSILTIKKAYQKACELEIDAKRLGIGCLHQEHGNWFEAKDAYFKQLNKNPFDAEINYRLGIAHERSFQLDEAEFYYRAALAIDHEQPFWHFRLGFVLESQEKFEEAALAYQYALAIRESYTPYWHYRLGYVLNKDSKINESINAYRLIKPENHDPQISFVLGKNDSTNPDNSNPSNLTPLPPTLSKRREAITNIEYYKKKFELFLRINAQNAISSNSLVESEHWVSLAKICERWEDWSCATEAYRKAISLNNQPSSEILYRLACSQANEHHLGAAIETFERIDLLSGFKRRIAGETKLTVLKLDLNTSSYNLIVKFENKSKINKDIEVEKFILKHRQRIGNEKDEVLLKHRRIKRAALQPSFEIEINIAELDLPLHYWDIYVDLISFDKVYGFTPVRVPIHKYSRHIIESVDTNPLNYSILDDETIFYPYRTAGGKKLAFLKRPISEYDNSIYFQREQSAITEYMNNKLELDRRNAWMIFEKFSETAQDNGYHFFKYAVSRRPHVYFVITKNSLDRKYLDEYSHNVVDFMSVEHMILLLSCSLIISSEGRGHGYAWRRTSGSIRNALLHKPYVFLQHGVISLKKLGNTFAKRNKNCAADKFIVSSPYEKELISSEFGYADEDLILSGLPRWGSLEDKSHGYNQILLMPSWRNWLEDISDEEFISSEYFLTYSALLSSPNLHYLLEKFKSQLVFCLHPRILVHMSKFCIQSDCIRPFNPDKATIRDLIQVSSALITDYSSIAWDFAYLNKPSLFYHFDLVEYERYQGAYIDLRCELPGPVSYTDHELIDKLELILSGDITPNDFPKIHDFSSIYPRGTNPSEIIFSKLTNHYFSSGK